MEILKICGVIMLGLALSIILKSRDNALGSHISTVTAICVLVFCVSLTLPIINYIKEIASQVDGGEQMISLLLKTMAILLVTQTLSEICAQNGEKLLSNVLDYAATITITLLALPTIKSIVNETIGLIKG